MTVSLTADSEHKAAKAVTWDTHHQRVSMCEIDVRFLSQDRVALDFAWPKDSWK